MTIRRWSNELNRCIDAVNKIDDSILKEIQGSLASFFTNMLKNHHGGYVQTLPTESSEIEASNIIFVDTRFDLVRLCGVYDELERTYVLSIFPRRKPIYISFESWLPEHCMMHCAFDYDSDNANKPAKLTLMPMTAAIIRFPETVRMRVEPL
jgi:hypothetical protein